MLHLVRAASLALVLVGPASAQDLAERADALMTAYHDAGRFDGSVLIADGDEVVYEAGFGQANRSWGVPNAPDTRHRVASVTKQFTAALVLQLVESGDLALDAPVTRYLPDYPAAQGDRVTVHHLLSHTGGVPDHTGGFSFDDMMRDPITPTAFLAVFSDRPLDFEPGTQFRYSNSGYVLLGALIEAVTGQSYADAVRQRLAVPLGLADTGVQTNGAVLDRMASGYTRAVTRFRNAAYIDASVPYSAGMIVSTVRDLHRWTRALHAGEPFGDPATLERMTTPVMGDYAYGVERTTRTVDGRSVRVVEHSGGIPGSTSWLAYFPESGRTVAVLSNASDDVDAVVRALTGVIHGETPPAPTASVPVILARVAEAEGVGAALARYREVRAGGGGDENYLDALGHVLLGDGDVDGALRVFRANAEAYSDAPSPYASLGEAYLEAQDPEGAAAAYLRLLELDPENDRARAWLGRMGVAVPEAEAVVVPSDVLDAYLGRYALAPTFVLTVTREGSTLFVQGTGQERLQLAAVSQTRFRVLSPTANAQVSFTRVASAPASTLTLHQNGRDKPAGRVE